MMPISCCMLGLADVEGDVRKLPAHLPDDGLLDFAARGEGEPDTLGIFLSGMVLLGEEETRAKARGYTLITFDFIHDIQHRQAVRIPLHVFEQHAVGAIITWLGLAGDVRGDDDVRLLPQRMIFRQPARDR